MWDFHALFLFPILLFSISIQLVEVCNLLVFASIFLKISLDKRWNNSKCVNIVNYNINIIRSSYILACGSVITVYHLGYTTVINFQVTLLVCL